MLSGYSFKLYFVRSFLTPKGTTKYSEFVALSLLILTDFVETGAYYLSIGWLAIYYRKVLMPIRKVDRG